MPEKEGDALGWQSQELSPVEWALAQERKLQAISEKLHSELIQTFVIVCAAVITLAGCIVVWTTAYSPESLRNLAVSMGMISVFVIYFLFDQLIVLYRGERTAQSLRVEISGRIVSFDERDKMAASPFAHG
jgi:hypothetical protein